MLVYLMLLPPQLSVSILGTLVPPYRAFLLLASLYVLSAGLTGRFRLTWPDILILAATAWINFAMFMTSIYSVALTASLSHFVDILLAYFFARAAIRSSHDFRYLLILIAPGLLMVGIILVAEAVTKVHIVQGFFSELTGANFEYRSDPRFGLLRAQGPFPHPILAGLFLSGFLPLYWLSGIRGWPKFAGIFAALFSFASVSSVALLALVAGSALLAYNWATERFSNVSWGVFFVALAVVTFAAELGTKSGVFGLFARFGALNSQSSFTRLLIWEHGSQNVAENPWFGLGYGDWTRPFWMGESVDNYWLLLAMRFGIPAVLCILIATGIAFYSLARKSALLPLIEQRCARGLAVGLALYFLGMVSVAVCLSPHSWFYMVLGIAVTLGAQERLERPIMKHPPAHILRRR